MLQCIWHAIVGAFWKKDLAVELDTWILVSFCAIFLLCHLGALGWVLFARRQPSLVEKEERAYLEDQETCVSVDIDIKSKRIRI